MSIYIFDPAGGGGSQNLQQVLTTGSTLTTNNTIDFNGLILQFGGGNYSTTNLGYANYDVVTIGSLQQDGHLRFYPAAGGETYFAGRYYNGVVFVDNFIKIHCVAEQYYIGDYAQLLSGGYISVETTSIYNKVDYFEIREINAGSGSLNLHGTAYIDTVTNPSTNAGHLVINVNGTPHYIAVKT